MAAVRERELARLRSMTPTEKVAAMESLRRQAWALTEAGVRIRHPHWTDQQVLAEVRELWLGARDA